jgi:hypothetical protein
LDVLVEAEEVRRVVAALDGYEPLPRLARVRGADPFLSLVAEATGHVLWKRRLPSFSFAAPAIAGNRLFAAGADGTLRGLATATGKVVAAVRLGAPSTGAPAVAEGRLVVGAGAEPFLPGHLLVGIGHG